MHGGLREILDTHVVAAAQGGDLVRAEVAGHVDIARLDQHALGGRLGHVAE